MVHLFILSPSKDDLSYQVYLARLACRLSWQETPDIFKTSWDSVFRAVQFDVDHGLAFGSDLPWLGCQPLKRGFAGSLELSFDVLSLHLSVSLRLVLLGRHDLDGHQTGK